MFARAWRRMTSSSATAPASGDENWKLRFTTFEQFGELSDDLKVSVLSFAVDVPFESPITGYRSSLTHVLPLVCKEFHRLFKQRADYFWKSALLRLVEKDPSIWEAGLLHLLPTHVRETFTSKKRKELVEKAYNSLELTSYQQLFQGVSSYLRFTGPVFYMPAHIRLGRPFGLHFFEPRYRLLISEVMANYPVAARRGEEVTPVNGQLPTFIYAHVYPLAPTSPACLVQVQQCLVHPNGTADVVLVPTEYVWLERIWERPGTGNLLNAVCMRMDKESSRTMDTSTQRRDGGFMGGWLGFYED